MHSRKVLVLTDNFHLYCEFRDIAKEEEYADVAFDYRYSPKNKQIEPSHEFFPLDVKTELETIVATYDLVISLHCKQFFPRIWCAR